MAISTEPTESTGRMPGSEHTVAAALLSAERTLAPISEDDARIEAELLLANVLELDRSHLLARLADHLAHEQGAAFELALRRRLAREPLSYITGRCEFYNVEIACSPAALIPRWESEMLVEFALERAREYDRGIRVADVGTGTGAIAIAIAANAPNLEVTATDTSADALALARRNVERHCLADCVTLVGTDLLAGLGAFDVIVANLPYVTEGEWPALEPEVRDHEPRTALVGGESGLEVIERLLHGASTHLAAGGVLATEIGAAHGAAALAIGRAGFPNAEVSVEQDIAGHDRMLVVRT